MSATAPETTTFDTEGGPFQPTDREKRLFQWMFSQTQDFAEVFKKWVPEWVALTGLNVPIGQIVGWRTQFSPVASLPPSPADGQRVTFDTGQTGVYWDMVYSTTLSKWIFVGGPPISAEVTTGESTTSVSYVDLATVGPSLTAPLAGSYLVTFGATLNIASAGNTARATVKVGAAAAGDTNSVRGGDVDTSVARAMPLTLAAGDVLLMQYRGTTGLSSTFRNRFITMFPQTVSPP